jgi:two-component system cell cycle sensor histidine kinase/response regulator CckA
MMTGPLGAGPHPGPQSELDEVRGSRTPLEGAGPPGEAALPPSQLLSTQQPVTPPGILGNETILLVEDDDDVRGVVKEGLSLHGYAVLDARDEDAALRLAERHPTRIDLLVTDVVLPRTSGPLVAARIADRQPGLKVLFMSGFAGDLALDEGSSPTPGSLLDKPFTIETLARKVREVLDAAA